jgi:ferric-dicitrate binding protein FerR (iron transport regulator)
MRRLFVVTTLICGLLSLSMPTAWASAPDMARVEGLRGTVSVRAGASAGWQEFSGSQDLAAGASLRTAAESEALLELPGDVQVRVAPGSEVQVSRLEGREVEIKLQSGRLFAAVPAGADAGSRLQVVAPTGEAVCSGGEFTMDAAADAANLRVLSGSASLAGSHVSYAGMGEAGQAAVQVPAGVEAVAQADDQGEGAGGTQGTGGTGTGGGGTGAGTGAGGGFPWLAVLGGVGLLALIAVLVSQSSEVQSG